MASIWKHFRSPYWTACWRDATGKQCRASTKTTDKRLARRMADEFERASRNKRTLAQLEKILRGYHEELGGEGSQKYSLQTFCSEWLAEKEPSVSTATKKFYRTTLGKLSTYFGERALAPIAEITYSDLVGFRNELASQLSATSTNHALTCIKGLFKSARRLGRIAEDPSEFLSPVRELTKSSEDEKRRSFSLGELQILLAAADPEWGSMIKVGLYTGARLADVATLRWSQVDLERGEIAFTPRKTDKRIILPVVGPLLEHIGSLTASDDPNGFLHPRAAEIFNRSNTSATLSHHFADLLSRAGLRSPASTKPVGSRHRSNALSFHSLRHTMVSLLKDRGVAQAVVQELAGHASVAISARYTHVGKEALERAVASLPRL
jgi:integrase